MKSNEKCSRSLVKAVCYRLYQSFLISPFIYFLTGDFELTVKVFVLEMVVKIPSYFVFERLWSYVKRGYKK